MLFIFACDSESANDCFQTSGNIVTKTISVTNFERILVNRNIELILTHGSDTSLTIETGENLINDVSATVENNQLILTDNNTCNFVRDFDATVIRVTAPNITEIRSSTQFEVFSNETLSYSNLHLISENDSNSELFNIGDFRLSINANQLQITSNGLSSYYINGSSNELNIGFFSGDGRIEARDFAADDITIFHRGTNDMIINPQNSLTANLVSTGNVIAVNTPPNLNIQEQFDGRVIFE